MHVALPISAELIVRPDASHDLPSVQSEKSSTALRSGVLRGNWVSCGPDVSFHRQSMLAAGAFGNEEVYVRTALGQYSAPDMRSVAISFAVLYQIHEGYGAPERSISRMKAPADKPRDTSSGWLVISFTIQHIRPPRRRDMLIAAAQPAKVASG